MSWVVGCSGCDAALMESALREEGLEPLHRIRYGTTVLAAGGLPETCLYVHAQGQPDGEAHHVVLGLGLREGASRRRAPMRVADWASVLGGAGVPADVAGHYLVITVRSGGVAFVNDRLGLRTLYLREWNGGLLFSTREDLLRRMGGPRMVNLGVLGAQWLTFNRWTSDALLEGVESLPPGGTARYERGKLVVEATPWAPRTGASTADAFLDVFVRHAMLEDVSLGLSGGLDSRALLALLLGSGATPDTHVFGDRDDADVRVARRIAAATGLRQRHLPTPIPPLDEAVRLMEQHAAEARVIVPASQALKVRPYTALHESGKLVIDGGFGEITRRQFMNRLLVRAPDRLLAGDAEGVLPYVAFSRGNVFAPEVALRMREGALQQIQRALDDVRRTDPETAEHAADLLAVRTRLPWYFGIEQARMDGHVQSIMPFAQPEVLDAALRLPLRLRRRGRLIKQLIRAHQPALARMPLVKGATTVPFWAPREVGWAMLLLHQRMNPSSSSGYRKQFLARVRPYVEALVQSASFRSCDLYAHDEVVSLVHRYFAGEQALGAQVDWWIALEQWRQRVQM